MPSKMASLAAIGAGAYGASLAFTSATSRATGSLHSRAVIAEQQQNLRGTSTAQSAAGLSSAACALGGAALAAGGAQASKRANRRSVHARAVLTTEGTSQKLTTPSDLLDGVDIFIFDCDGVIWRGDSLIPGIPKVLDDLRAAGKTLFFVTNNSTKSRAGYKSKFTSLGLDVKPEEIFSSSFAAAAYLEQTNFKATGKKVYIIGEKGISEELDLIGVPHFGAEADADKEAELKPGGRVEHDPEVGAVLVGFDRNINYYKLQYAQLCLNENPGCEFIATNLDRVTHLTDAQEWAGNGTMVGAVKGCTGMEPTLVGKPAPLMIDYIAEKYNITDRSRICMVGDRLDTDIAFGNNNGLKTCLTLSGVTSEDELLDRKPRKAGTEGITPQFYVDTINDFIAGAPQAAAPPAPAPTPAAPAPTPVAVPTTPSSGAAPADVEAAKKDFELKKWVADRLANEGSPEAAAAAARAQQAEAAYKALEAGGAPPAPAAAPAPTAAAVPAPATAPAPAAAAPRPAAMPATPAPVAASGASPADVEAAKQKAELLKWTADKLTADGSPQAAAMQAKAAEAMAAYEALKQA